MKVSSHRRSRALAPRRFGLLRVRDWRVATKLAAVLLIPAAAFLVIGGVQINTSVRDAAQLEDFAKGVTVGRELTALVHELQRERDHTAGVLARIASGTRADPTAISAELANEHAAVDAAMEAFLRVAQPVQQSNTMFRSTSDQIAEDFRQLKLVREGVRSRWLRQEAAFTQYTSIMGHMFALVPTPNDVGGDTVSAQNIASLVELAEAKELAAQLRGLIFAAVNSGALGTVDSEQLAEVQARQVATVERFRAQASPDHLAEYDQTMRGTAVSSVSRLQKIVFERARTGNLGISAEEWWRVSSTQLELLRSVERDLLEDAIRGAADRAASERRQAVGATSAIVITMLVALLLSWLIGRSMVESLRALRAQALDVAQHRLPAAIESLRSSSRTDQMVLDTSNPIRSADEIGDVADAFTAVHRSAVTLAVEQATMRRNVNAMFVNLARRSQTLVERQLQLLDSLEAAETDPDQLSNLFKLDHLATRMRRNDENLLVLAGSEVSRRWAQPVALSAVALAAMAEIEQYARIRHDIAGGVYVVGHAVADIVHLLAELLENATTFSPPDTVVTVTGWLDRASEEAVIIIEDHGIGMTEAGFAEANERLAGPVDIDVSASERMGLVVVGHLAARHRVRVRLRGSTAGVAVYVSLPSSILAAAPQHEEGYGNGPGRLSTVVRPQIARAAGNTAIRPGGLAVPRAIGSAPAPATAMGSAGPLPPDSPLRPFPQSGSPSATEPPPWPPIRQAGMAQRGDAPVSGVPVSSAPVSGVPVSSVPVSGPSGNGAYGYGPEQPGSANPVSGNGAGRPNTSERPRTDRNRRGPKRAEDVLEAATGAPAAPAGTRWWSRDPNAAPARTTPALPVQRDPVPAGVSAAGLPLRVPMAQLPTDAGETQRLPNGAGYEEPDPMQVSSVLSRFYSGVHRAAHEDEIPTQPINDRRGATRESKPTST